MSHPQPPREIADVVRKGGVIPAHPLALTKERTLDERRQRALSRYYIDAGAIGLAVGVEATDSRIHDPKGGLLTPVLTLAMETARDWKKDQLLAMLAGLEGKTRQAVKEAELARSLGYHFGVLSLAAMSDSSEDKILDHCDKVAQVIPLVALQERAGKAHSEELWRKLAEIPNLVGLTLGPYDRYQTLAAVTGVARSTRKSDVALYTGNEDAIVLDLVTPYVVDADGSKVRKEIVGGLLAHWSFWTKRATDTHRETKKPEHAERIPRSLFTLAGQITESNAAIFDRRGPTAGGAAGVLYVLKRSGLVEGVWTLDPDVSLTRGQADRIERVIRAYPHLTDDTFVQDHLERWLAD